MRNDPKVEKCGYDVENTYSRYEAAAKRYNRDSQALLAIYLLSTTSLRLFNLIAF